MLTPGEILTTFRTKSGQNAVLRIAQVSDAVDLMNFINIFSVEDSFTRFSGEQLSLEEEEKYLQSEVQGMAAGDVVKLFCYVDRELAGVCDVHRDTSLLTRKRHLGILGLIVGKDFRGQGVGEHLMTTTIQAAETHILGLRIITLDCFAPNIPALSLYHKLGFKEVGRVPKALLHKNEYVDEIIMTKELIA